MNSATIFTVGDRVIGAGWESGVDIRGMTGTIMHAANDIYSVEFDEPNRLFHSCGGRTKHHHGFYCLPDVLESYCNTFEWELDSDLSPILL